MHTALSHTAVSYIYHSAFVVKTAEHVLVFDYYTDGPGAETKIENILSDAPSGRKIVVFASHGHGDHYNAAILGWADKFGPVEYVFSDDITVPADPENVTTVSPGNTYKLAGLEVRTLLSTDLGVAFLVRCDGLTIFHAGDLNWWHWEGEPDEDNLTMAQAYKQQIDLLRGEQIDLAFIPVDPRLEQQYNWGLNYFLTAVGAQKIFPMHFGTDYSIFARLRRDLGAEDSANVVEISPRCTEFVYPD